MATLINITFKRNLSEDTLQACVQREHQLMFL